MRTGAAVVLFEPILVPNQIQAIGCAERKGGRSSSSRGRREEEGLVQSRSRWHMFTHSSQCVDVQCSSFSVLLYFRSQLFFFVACRIFIFPLYFLVLLSFNRRRLLLLYFLFFYAYKFLLLLSNFFSSLLLVFLADNNLPSTVLMAILKLLKK